MFGAFLDALAPDRWPTFVIVGGRFVGLMFAAPLWSSIHLPRGLRAALVAVFSLAVLPTVPNARLAPDTPGFVAPLAAELVVGLAIGLTGAVLLAGVALAAEVVSIQMGLNLGAALTGSGEMGGGGLGELETLFAATCFIALGGHLVLLTGVARSFATIPPGAALDLVAGGRSAAALAGTVFTTALRVAAPVLVALLLANLAIALLARAAPQLNMLAVAFPVTIGLGLVVVGIALPAVGRYVADWVQQLPVHMGGIVGAYAPGGN